MFQRGNNASQKATATVVSSAESGCGMREGQLSQPAISGSSDRSVLSGGGVSVPSVVDPGVELFGDFEFEDLWNMTGLDFMVYDEENPLFAQ